MVGEKLIKQLSHNNFKHKLLLYVAYLSSWHRTASDAYYWTTLTLFIAMTTSCLEESAPAFHPFIQCSCEVLRIHVHCTKFLLQSKPCQTEKQEKIQLKTTVTNNLASIIYTSFRLVQNQSDYKHISQARRVKSNNSHARSVERKR